MKHQRHCKERPVSCPFFGCDHEAQAADFTKHVTQVHRQQVRVMEEYWCGSDYYHGSIDIDPSLFCPCCCGSDTPRFRTMLVGSQGHDVVFLFCKRLDDDKDILHIRFFHVIRERLVELKLGQSSNVSFSQRTDPIQELHAWYTPDALDVEGVVSALCSGCLVSFAKIAALSGWPLGQSLCISRCLHYLTSYVEVWGLSEDPNDHLDL